MDVEEAADCARLPRVAIESIAPRVRVRASGPWDERIPAARRAVTILTMRRLYLLRHAKSSWKDPDLADLDRPLARRGRRASKAIAGYLREQDIEPELVLCSSARRTRETLERLEPALGSPTVRIEPELYAASASALLERLRRVPDAVGSVMLIGHNPGMQDLALDVARPAPAVRELELKFPTAALATLVLQAASWRALDRGTAELVDFVRSRDLEG